MGRRKPQLSPAKGLDTSDEANCPTAQPISRYSKISSFYVHCGSLSLSGSWPNRWLCGQKARVTSALKPILQFPEEIKPHLITRYPVTRSLMTMENAEAASLPLHYPSHCPSPLCGVLIRQRFTSASYRCKLGYKKPGPAALLWYLAAMTHRGMQQGSKGWPSLNIGTIFQGNAKHFWTQKPSSFPLAQMIAEHFQEADSVTLWNR